MNNILIDKLLDFKSKRKFSDDAWKERGLNPSGFDKCQNLELLFNQVADNLIEIVTHDHADNTLKSVLKKGLKNFNKAEYDTGEKEFICDLYYDLADIVHIDFKSEINIWLHGYLLNKLLILSKLINPEKTRETLQHPCTKCRVQLETLIIQKEDGIPDNSWLIVRCNYCKEFNLISPGPNIKKFKFGNYQCVESLSKADYSRQQAFTRLDQIKTFRK